MFKPESETPSDGARDIEAEIDALDKEDRKQRRSDIKQKIKDLVAEKLGAPNVDDALAGTRQMRLEKDGQVDIALYTEVQKLGYLQKANFQWAPEDHIKIIAKMIAKAQPDAKVGLCHGTRTGQEQAWLSQELGPEVEIAGTEISEAASGIPDTIAWDFHDTKPEWIGAIDFIYSNSWDHTYDPQKLFKAWISCLAPGGRLYLDHSADQSGASVDFLGLFGAEEYALINLLNEVGSGLGKVVEISPGAIRKRDDLIKIVVFERSV